MIACQDEFKEFVKKVERKRSILEKEAEASNDWATVVEIFFESLIRTASGDPWGTARDVMSAEKELKSKFQDFDIATQNEAEEFTKREKKITNNIHTVRQQLERIAVQYNAKFN
jgi:hypothetical protein